jgi:hypothetical protein
MQKCWICNLNEANSGEHKIKASDIRKLMGDKKFDGFFKIEGEDFITINNSKHKSLKFPKVICDDCNNRITGQSDNSYDDFISYVTNNYDDLVADMKIDFKKIYGENWQKRKADLYRYLAKHAGCKTFSDHGEKYIDLSELSSFILGKESIKNFHVFFQLNEVIRFFSFATETERIENINPLLANGATIKFGFQNNNIFAGTIINSFLRINWLVTDRIFDIKQIDFNDEFENIELLGFDFYPTPFGDFKENIEAIQYLMFGKFNESNHTELTNYFIEKFEEIHKRI